MSQINKKMFVFAGIVLAIAIATPTIALITQTDRDLDDLINQAPNLADETQAQDVREQFQERHTTLFTIVLSVEIVCVIFFAILLWLGLKP